MAKSVIYKKRLKFPVGMQRKFIYACLEKLNCENKDIAKKLSVSVRSITDWKREKFSISVDAAKMLSKTSKVKIPKNVKELNEFWYVSKGARKGGLASYKKQGGIIGDPEIRKQRWHEWWEKTGKFQKRTIFFRKSITKPKKDVYLAEFVGIMLGDGGITKNQVTVTLNRETDHNYVIYVKNLMEKLFEVTPSLIKDKYSLGIDLVISRTALVDFCRDIGLKIGNKIKQGADMPDWVKTNKKLMRLCVRGLIDTDGSFFTHKYFSKGKLYKYKKIDFSSCSQPLLNSIFVFLKNLGLRPRIDKDGKKIRIESVDTVKKIYENHRNKQLKTLEQISKID